MEIIVVLTSLVVIVLFVKGGIRTFQKRFWLALFLLIFLNPIWIIWAIIEIFSGGSSSPVQDATLQKKKPKRNQKSTDGSAIALTASAISTKHEDIAPVITPRDHRDQIISVEKKQANTWEVKVKLWYNDQVGYSERKHSIGRSISGFSIGQNSFDVNWK